MKRGDLVAGLCVAGLMLPEAVAYSAIAGLPAQHAILAAIAGAAVYALVGGSRFAIVSPTSSSATILAAMIGMTATGVATKAMFATVTTFFVGMIFVLAGLLRLGGLTSFVSRPVLRGFALGLGITIIIKQLPNIAGVNLGHGSIWRIITGLAGQFPHWNWPSAAIGILSLIALLALRKIPELPGTICVLAAGIAASVILDLPTMGVATVGIIPMSIQWPDFSSISARDAEGLLELTLPLLLVLLAESWGTMRTLALQHNDTLNADQELVSDVVACQLVIKQILDVLDVIAPVEVREKMSSQLKNIDFTNHPAAADPVTMRAIQKAIALIELKFTPQGESH